jgi:catechol 2,3-dioxygenase-like lactoylglutathione lyase family enzyme
MLDHVSITVSDIAAAERLYDAIMKALGVVKARWAALQNGNPPLRAPV